MARAIRSADEQDVFTGWRRAYSWTQRPGECKRVKQRANRRERREGRNLVLAEWPAEILEEDADGCE